MSIGTSKSGKSKFGNGKSGKSKSGKSKSGKSKSSKGIKCKAAKVASLCPSETGKSGKTSGDKSGKSGNASFGGRSITKNKASSAPILSGKGSKTSYAPSVCAPPPDEEESVTETPSAADPATETPSADPATVKPTSPPSSGSTPSTTLEFEVGTASPTPIVTSAVSSGSTPTVSTEVSGPPTVPDREPKF